ncbi:hypothetical protein SAMN05192559_11117 [Halobacillus karajensis]|uniref:Uncharacterized protein n=1 Tax=Halobacillus karajensis TaxID=195088 RepID=A0A024P989_9BACI|nr:hypothetical protein [Halobacillus karajensis]CDQ21580.1 hypothetical protein BN982_03983 [Halobacillus karajensis]CDQ25515.1 hypothetical protein BN983_03862 [Halobacillus karajensis]CDQ28955.1 hypothetical protein BN981_03298 [Halobacillus karajensis]SEI08781.1 hypothetical protein SAMN05192559_11117 [Halobacillus karajensis]
MKKGANKSKWILIAASLIIFAVGTYFFTDSSEDKLVMNKDSKPMRKAKPVDLEDFPVQWNEVKTYEEINQYYEEHIMGLELAREEGLTVFPQESTSIPDKEGRMQINEVWHSGNTIHLLYSIDLSALTKDETNDDHSNYPVQYPSVEGVRIENQEGNNKQSYQNHSKELHPRETVVFENRLYSFIQLPPITEDWGENIQAGKVKDYDEEFLTSFLIRIHNQTVETDSMIVRYVHDLEGHTLNTFTKEKVYTDDNITIGPMEMKTGVASSQVKMRIDAGEKEVGPSLQALLKTENGDRHPVSLFLNQTNEDNVYESWFPPVGDVSGEVEMELSSIYLQGDHPYSFKIDMTQFERNRNISKNMDKKIAEFYDTDIILEGIDLHNRNQMNLRLRYDPHKENQPQKLVGSQIAPLDTLPDKRKKYVEVISNEGQSIDGEIWGHDESGLINFQTHSFSNAEELTITVKKMTFSKELDHTFTLHQPH